MQSLPFCRALPILTCRLSDQVLPLGLLVRHVGDTAFTASSEVSLQHRFEFQEVFMFLSRSSRCFAAPPVAACLSVKYLKETTTSCSISRHRTPLSRSKSALRRPAFLLSCLQIATTTTWAFRIQSVLTSRILEVSASLLVRAICSTVQRSLCSCRCR